jgi:hypothetical protein
MAFTTPKYELIFNDIFQASGGLSDIYRIRIWKDNYSGTTYNMIGSSNPIVIETANSEGNSYIPIISTRATVNLIQFTGFDITEFLNADDNDFQLTLEKGIDNNGSITWNNVVWRGFFVPVESIQFSVISPVSYSLVFIDGLAKLKESRYFYDGANGVGFNPREVQSVKNLIVSCISKTDQTLNIWINEYYKTASVASRNIDNMNLRRNYFLKQPGEYYTFYEILEGICRTFGWECYYYEDKWILQSYGSLTRGSSYTYYVYDINGNYLSTQTPSTVSPVLIDNTNSFVQKDGSLTISVNKAKYSFYNKAIIDNNRGLPNNRFISWTGGNLDAFTNAGVTAVQSFIPLGLTITSHDSSPGGGSDYLRNANPFQVKAGDYLSIIWKDVFNPNTFGQYSVTISDGATTYYIQDNGEFTLSPNILPDWNSVAATWPDYSICPIDGDMYLTIYNPYYNGGGGGTSLQTVEYFIIQQYSVSSNSFNFDGINYISSKGFRFSSETNPFLQFGYFVNIYLRDAVDFIVQYNDKDQVATDYFIGAFLNNDLLKVSDEFGRNTTGIEPLFKIVSQDIGIDELQTQYTIEGDFKSIGYWINNKFTYSYDGVNTYTYLLKDIKWDVKMATQTCKFCKINYSGSDIILTTTNQLNVKQ